VRRREAAEAILNQVQKLDQQVTPARRIAEQRRHFFTRLRIDDAALGRRADAGALSFGSTHWTD